MGREFWGLEMQDTKKSSSGTIAQLCRAIFSQLRHVSTIGKNLVKQAIPPPRPYNMVNFGPLAAEIRLIDCRPLLNTTKFG